MSLEKQEYKVENNYSESDSLQQNPQEDSSHQHDIQKISCQSINSQNDQPSNQRMLKGYKNYQNNSSNSLYYNQDIKQDDRDQFPNHYNQHYYNQPNYNVQYQKHQWNFEQYDRQTNNNVNRNRKNQYNQNHQYENNHKNKNNRYFNHEYQHQQNYDNQIEQHHGEFQIYPNMNYQQNFNNYKQKEQYKYQYQSQQNQYNNDKGYNNNKQFQQSNRINQVNNQQGAYNYNKYYSNNDYNNNQRNSEFQNRDNYQNCPNNFESNYNRNQNGNSNRNYYRNNKPQQDKQKYQYQKQRNFDNQRNLDSKEKYKHQLEDIQKQVNEYNYDDGTSDNLESDISEIKLEDDFINTQQNSEGKQYQFKNKFRRLQKYNDLQQIRKIFEPLESVNLSTPKLDESISFLIRPQGHINLHQAIKYGIWASSEQKNIHLSDAFRNFNNVFLFFIPRLSKVNEIYLEGVARLESEYNQNRIYKYWDRDESYQGTFQIKWIYVKSINISNVDIQCTQYYSRRPIDQFNDCSFIETYDAMNLMQQFEKSPNSPSIFDQFPALDIMEDQIRSYRDVQKIERNVVERQKFNKLQYFQ